MRCNCKITFILFFFFFFQAEDGIRDSVASRGLGMCIRDRFSIGVAAAETAVALAIIINVYRNYHSDQVNSIENMKF